MKTNMEEMLVKGEKIIAQAQLSLIPTIVWAVISVLCLFLNPIFGIIVFIIFGSKPLLGYLFNTLVITNKRVLGKVGFIKKSELDMPINKVNAFSVSNTLLGGILGYKRIQITSMGDGWWFNYVKNAKDLKKAFYEEHDEK